MAEAALEKRLTELWEGQENLYAFFATVDHKKLGVRYLVTAFFFLLVGGVEALIMRIQLSQPGLRVLSPEAYNQIFSMHGTTMIWWYASPILSGFGVFLIPLMCGARDLAFPRLNAFTYWTYLLSGVMLYIGPIIGQAPHAGWFAYVPYTLTQYSPGMGMDYYVIAILLLTISTTGNSINFIVTILRMRAPGMAVSRMPLFLYSSLTISIVALFSLPSLTAALLFLELDRRYGTHFYSVIGGGDTFLWQQLFWFFGHPWVYIVFLPATGMLNMIIPVFSRRPIVGYPFLAASTMLTGVVGFGVWLHHMFTVGMSDIAMSFFSAGSMTVSLFTTITVFAWVATIWKGRPVATTSMHFAVGSIAMLVIGGLSGVYTGVIPVDWQAHNTYFVVAHIHYVLIGSNLFPVFAGWYYWGPKITGKMMNERLGKWSFWVMFIGFNVGFFPMHILGLVGMPRRIFTYMPGLGFTNLNMIITVGAFVLGIGILLSMINLFITLHHGEPAGPNPWNSDGLEWDCPSPPPAYEIVHIPVVATRHPLWDDFEESEDPDNDRVLDGGRWTVMTTVLDAEPVSIATIAEDSLQPLWVSLAVYGFLQAMVVQLIWVAAGMLVATALFSFLWMWPRTKQEIVPKPEEEAV